MIRVMKSEEPTRFIVTVDGDLSGDHIAVVEFCCQEAESSGKPVELVLRDVTIVDHVGRSLLGRLAAKGVRLIADGVYTSYLVESLASAGSGRSEPSLAKRFQRGRR